MIGFSWFPGFLVKHVLAGWGEAPLELSEQCAQLPLRVLVMLLNRELQGIFEQRFRVVAPPKLQQQFPEENSSHHPVGFLRDTKFIMGHCFWTPAVRDERLRETEVKHLVPGIARDQRGEMLNPR